MNGNQEAPPESDEKQETDRQAQKHEAPRSGVRLTHFGVAGALILLLLAVGVGLLAKFLSSRPLDMTQNVARIDVLIDTRISESIWDIQPIDVTQENMADGGVVWMRVSRSYKLPPVAHVRGAIVGALRDAVAHEGAELHVLEEDREGMLVSITLAGAETHSLRFVGGTASSGDEIQAIVDGEPDAAPIIAIIVDDLGYGGDATERLFSLTEPLTISVLPDLVASRKSAERARDARFEVMLHLPMEAEEEGLPQPGELRVGMSRDAVARLIEQNLATVPGAVGINNHRGSRITRLEGEMSKLMPIIGESDLYFVDSLTTPESVALDVARKSGLKAVGNDLFLDNDDDTTSVEEKLEELMRIATRRGYAVGICHARTVTIDVLLEKLPTVRERGFRLVRVSELLDKY